MMLPNFFRGVLGFLVFMGAFFDIDALDRSAFYTRSLELYPRIGYRYEFYQTIKSGSHRIDYHARNSYLDLGIKAAYQPYAFELEATLANSRCFSTHLDHLSALGKWQLLNEDVADPLSLCVGANLTWIPNEALIDPSVFHRGFVELEFFLSAGRSFYDCWDICLCRIFGVVGAGLADKGSPWINFELCYEKFFCENLSVGASLAGLYGFGGDRFPKLSRIGRCHLKKHKKCTSHFKGYGPIAYRFLGADVYLNYQFESDAILSVYYGLGLYAQNAPAHPQELGFCLTFPFGL